MGAQSSVLGRSMLSSVNCGRQKSEDGLTYRSASPNRGEGGPDNKLVQLEESHMLNCSETE